jgi:thiamine-monophosphate kinase
MIAMGWNEAELLRWLARRPRPAILFGSAGHDAAVLRRLAGRPVVCGDQVVEGVHAPTGCPGRALGRKAAGRALSDLAATAARPCALLLCIAAPRTERASRLRAVIEAVDEKAREHGAFLVGGDLSATDGSLRLAVTALGSFAQRRTPPGRPRARPGELVLVSGPLGGSALGRHLEPRPRFAEAEFLCAHGARALMDVSDGLALDLARLAEASRVRIDLEHVPIHADARRAARASGLTPRMHALGDGEDYELIATLAPAAWQRARTAAARRFPLLTVIGKVRAGRGLWLTPEGKAGAGDGAARDGARGLRPWDRRGGWIHGA